MSTLNTQKPRLAERPPAWRGVIIIGFAIFAIYFGAGNLIFPPFIGSQAGDQWPAALLGMTLTGIALPILAVVAVGRAGGSFALLSRPIARWFHHAYNLIVMIGVGLLITIPRTGAVAYETGVRELVPGGDARGVQIVSVLVFFGITYLLANDLGAVADKVGAYLTPILLVLLITIVGVAVLNPVGDPPPATAEDPFYMAFTESYQTGDILTGLLCAVIFVEAFRGRGFRRRIQNTRLLTVACGIGFIGLFTVYGGLLYLGASGAADLPPDLDRTTLLVELVRLIGGGPMVSALGIAVIIACLTTAAGLTSVVANFLHQTIKIPHRAGVILVCVVGVVQALGGVERIVQIAGPIFLSIYPISILIVLLGLLGPLIPNDGVWKGSALLVALVSLYEAAALVAALRGATMPATLQEAYLLIPLADRGFGWVVPAIVGALLGGLMWPGRSVLLSRRVLIRLRGRISTDT